MSVCFYRYTVPVSYTTGKMYPRSLFFSRKILKLFLFALFISTYTFSQGSPEYGSGIKLNLSPEGNRYIRFISWNQVWFRSQQNNPGSLINGEVKNNTWDIGARRVRMIAYAQLSPRYLILAHWGINNQTFAGGGGFGSSGTGPSGAGKKPQLFFHDIWNEYAIVPAKNPKTNTSNKNTLYLGAGLHYWLGISRMTSASTLNFMTIDAPIFNWPMIEVSDQFMRQFGFYVKGKLGKLNYSASVNKPFATNSTPFYDSLKGRVAIDNNGDAKPSVQGYADYQFLDQEANVLPFRVGTYVGTKKVFNIGAGFYHNTDATKSTDLGGTIKKHNINLLGIDLFADLPVGNKAKNMAITAYSVFYNYNFGPNYWRTLGVMNTSTGFDPMLPVANRAINGPGNARMFIGTGNIFYTQAGLLLPKGKSNKLRVQPFGAYTWKKFDYLGEPGNYFDVGANFFIDGHNAKITPQYSTRPLYYLRNGQHIKDGTKGEFLIQFQVYL
ncbi:MAG TPA: hypothetical protein PK298_07120 [Chitinophagaceae bacterium]|nr:hypothetical protein [Chitinophagaceae bacterium]HQX72656.1 hypothetical protein [Chitinophagaceae bacterium]